MELTPDQMALNSYCLETSCYANNLLSNNFTATDCDSELCSIAKSLIPTLPENDGRSHWFFGYALYIGGGIHLLMSIAMVMSYFLIYSSNFVLPDYFYTYMYVIYEYIRLRYVLVPVYVCAALGKKELQLIQMNHC